MNCDRVFELLTGGIPGNPPGESSLAASEQRALAVHLLRCPQCRQLEQELAPALDLFQAAQDEERRAPHDVMPDWHHPAELAAAASAMPWFASPSEFPEPAPFNSRQRPSRDFNVSPPLSWWRVAAALLLGFVLAGIAQNSAPAPRNPAEHLMAQAGGVASGDAASLASRLAGTPLPHCVSQAALGLGSSQMCCTVCHHSEGVSAARQAAKAPVPSTLLASCMVCHTR
jgi:hypothetical protein